MKFIPILFSTPMVQAILEGRKTITRRVIKEANGWDVNWKVLPIKEQYKDGIQRYEIRCGTQYCVPFFKAKCNVGDVLWVRETSAWNGAYWLYRANSNNDDYYHDFDTYEKTEKIKWKPSIFMPKPACRLFLEVVSVRPERLQDITEGDAVNEGIKYLSIEEAGINHPAWMDYTGKSKFCTTAVGSFASLWQSINGEESWNVNPWVWVISYKKIERPENFLPA